MAKLFSKSDIKWYQGGLHFECTQCGNCCGGFPGYVWVSPEELVRIAEHLKTTPEEFQAKYLEKVGRRFTLIEKENYDCIFLERDGDGRGRCKNYVVYPMQCRTWPFWRNNLTTIDNWNELHVRCPGINKGRHYTCEEIDEMADKSPC